MAITAATKRSDFNAAFLPPEQSAPIFAKAKRLSAIQQLAQQVPLSLNGKVVPVMTGRPAASWVSEGAIKPSSKGLVDIVTITPQKIACIVVVSDEVLRTNVVGYVPMMEDAMAEAFAIAFDLAATQDAGPDGTVGGGPFATALKDGTKTVELGTATQANGGYYGDLVTGLGLLANTQDALQRTYRFNGIALSPRAEALLLGQTDTTGRPLLNLDNAFAANNMATSNGFTGQILGRPAYFSDGVDYFSTIGWMGDWTQAAWGVVGGIRMDVSTETAVTINGSLVSLFENNLVAIRAEAEYGFVVADAAAFVELTDVQTS
jgi:HK97 family phage major capsid protein